LRVIFIFTALPTQGLDPYLKHVVSVSKTLSFTKPVPEMAGDEE
jgi:hypothetical protein